jgi:ABC-type uncharacterized transport system ATPase subunit
MNNDEKILKAIEDLKQGQQTLQADVSEIKTDHGKRLAGIESDITDIKTEQKEQGKEQLEIERGQVRLERGLYAIKQIVEIINQTLVRTVKSHEKRIENLEEHTGTDNPLKH